MHTCTDDNKDVAQQRTSPEIRMVQHRLQRQWQSKAMIQHNPMIQHGCLFHAELEEMP